MRHRNHSSKLNRTSEHRAALLRNLAIALVRHERIRTTKVKAVQLRPFLEHLITLAKDGTLASQRLVLSRIGDRDTAHKLFNVVAVRSAERQGGYLRIIKDDRRMGDGAPMAFIEFVDVDHEALAKADMKPKTLKQRIHERRKAMKAVRA